MTTKRRQLQVLNKAAPGDSAHPLLSGAYPTGVVTAEHPLFPVKTAGGMPEMARELQAQGLEFEPTEGRFGCPENSYIVHNVTRQQMFDLGNRYGQEATVYAEHGKPELMYTNGANIGRAHPSAGVDTFAKDPPPDYFIKLPMTNNSARLKFDKDKIQDTPMRPLVAAMPAYSPPVLTKREELLGYIAALKKSVGSAHSHPHAYDWHDSHPDLHFHTKGHGVLVSVGFAKSTSDAAVEPGMQAAPPIENVVAPKEAGSLYAKHSAPFGSLDKQTPSDLFHYPLHGRLAYVQKLVKDSGHQVFHYGGGFGRPDFASRNYSDGQLGVAPLSGAPADQDYADAWRQTHELAHALTYPDINKLYGDGRRLGQLGKYLTQNEAMRAVHWEWLAAHKQRELLGGLGIDVPDDVFHRELNTVMHDAVHRAITGDVVDAASEGFHPHQHHVPLEVALGLVRDAAHQLGLGGAHDLLTKSETERAYSLEEAKKLILGHIAFVLRKHGY